MPSPGFDPWLGVTPRCDPETSDISVLDPRGGLSEGTIHLIDGVQAGSITGAESDLIPDDYYDWQGANQVQYVHDLTWTTGSHPSVFTVDADTYAGPYRDAHERGVPVRGRTNRTIDWASRFRWFGNNIGAMGTFASVIASIAEFRGGRCEKELGMNMCYGVDLPPAAWGGADAITLGGTVLFRQGNPQESLVQHEAGHGLQSAIGGPYFYAVWGLGEGLERLLGGHCNFLETHTPNGARHGCH